MSALKHKTALVTGAAQGIGKAIAIALAKEGAHVLLCDLASSAPVADIIQAQGMGSASALTVDLSAKDSVAVLAKEGEKRGGIDILVNNAGIGVPKAFLDLDEALWDRTLTINLKATAFLSQALIPQMQSKAQGVIINIVSDLGITGHPLLAHYSASKAALIALTRSLALAFAPVIRVNAIAPGPIDTPLLQNLGIPKEALIQSLPAKRLGLPEDVAATAVFLASDAASFYHGQVLCPNGGGVMP